MSRTIWCLTSPWIRVLKTKPSRPHPGLLDEKIVQQPTTTNTIRILVELLMQRNNSEPISSGEVPSTSRRWERGRGPSISLS